MQLNQRTLAPEINQSIQGHFPPRALLNPVYSHLLQRLGALMRQVSQLAATGSIRPLSFSNYSIGETANALRQLFLAAHVGKIVVANNGAADPRKLEGSCLVTGGLGALGQLSIRFLLGQGGRHIILLGRTARLL